MSAPEEKNLINPLRKYLRAEKLPHFFCPGCGCGQVLASFTRAVDALGLDIGSMVGIGGVGCTARIPVYVKMDALHGIHGRTLAWATGIKLHRPETKIVVFTGDGDALSIGGNHFIHAARRNLDVTVVLVNNLNFAMTGGQVAPMTPPRVTTMTTPFGNPESQFDACRLAAASGATYVARTTTAHTAEMDALMRRALAHRGFSLLEIISQCPTHYGRYAMGTAKASVMLDWLKKNSVPLASLPKGEGDLPGGRFVRGEFVDTTRDVFAGSSVYSPESEVGGDA